MSQRFHDCGDKRPRCGWCAQYDGNPVFRAYWDSKGAALHAAHPPAPPLDPVEEARQAAVRRFLGDAGGCCH